MRVPGPVNVGSEGPVGQCRAVRDAVHGVLLAVCLRPVKRSSLPQRGVLGEVLGGRAPGADDVRDVLAAVFPIHVQEDRESVPGNHVVRPAGDVLQFATGTLLLGVVAQPRAAAHGELLRALRKALVVVVLVAPLSRLERFPHLRDEPHESVQEGGLGPLLGSGAALRPERVRPGFWEVLERPARHPHADDQLVRRDLGAPVRATIIRQRTGPEELVPRPRMFRHVVVEDRVHRAVEPLRLPVRLWVRRDVTLGSMESRLQTLPQKWLVNWGPPSESSRSGGP